MASKKSASKQSSNQKSNSKTLTIPLIPSAFRNDIKKLKEQYASAESDIIQAIQNFLPVQTGSRYLIHFSNAESSSSNRDFLEMSARAGFATFKEYVGNSCMNRGKGEGFRLIMLHCPQLGLKFPLHAYDKLAKADISPDDILPALREATAWIKENQKR